MRKQIVSWAMAAFLSISLLTNGGFDAATLPDATLSAGKSARGRAARDRNQIEEPEMVRWSTVCCDCGRVELKANVIQRLARSRAFAIIQVALHPRATGVHAAN